MFSFSVVAVLLLSGMRCHYADDVVRAARTLPASDQILISSSNDLERLSGVSKQAIDTAPTVHSNFVAGQISDVLEEAERNREVAGLVKDGGCALAKQRTAQANVGSVNAPTEKQLQKWIDQKSKGRQSIATGDKDSTKRMLLDVREPLWYEEASKKMDSKEFAQVVEKVC